MFKWLFNRFIGRKLLKVTFYYKNKFKHQTYTDEKGLKDLLDVIDKSPLRYYRVDVQKYKEPRVVEQYHWRIS